jgi:hypothetical protein
MLTWLCLAAIPLLGSLITEPVVGVNIKYGPQIEINNYARLLMFSNHTAPLNLEDGDRRYFVFNSQAQPRSDDYYDQLHREIMTARGMNSIYSYLISRYGIDRVFNITLALVAACRGCSVAHQTTTAAAKVTAQRA